MLGGLYAKTGLFFSKLCFFWNFHRSRLFFDQSKLIQNFWVSLYLFWSIEPKVSINWKSCGTFFKNNFFRWVKHFFKKFSPLFLSIRLGQGKSSLFCRFRSVFLQGFPLSKPISPFYPSFCILFHVFMHKFMHFIGIFGTFQIGVFWWFKTIFSEIDHWVLFQ